MRELIGPILRFLLRPACVGALYVTALAGLASRAPGDDAALGRDAADVAAFVSDRFGAEVGRAAVAVVALAIAFGALLGVLAALVVALRDRMARAPRRTLARRAWAVLGVTAALHAWLVLRGMVRAPQLYADAWYAQGGARRTIQVLATDTLGAAGVTLLGLLALALYLAGPPSGWRAWPKRLRRALLPRRPVRASSLASAALALVAVALLASAFAPPRAARADAASGAQRLNVVVLAADSFRADRLTPRTAPALSALASRGMRFDRAYVSLPRTFPSWVTLLTGRHPHHHGIRSMFPRWEERAKDLDALPERLARAGWRTAVVSDYAGDIFSRVELGFSRVDTPSFDFRQLVRQRALERQTPLMPILHTRIGRAAFPVMREMNDAADPDMLADDAIRAIRDARAGGAPLFLTVFFSTAHFPYAAPAPYYGKFTRRAYRGRFKYHKPVGLGAEAPPDDEDIAQIRGLYDGAIASIDAAAARILAELDRQGIAGRTIVVVTADHGETLYEGGHGQGHGDHLFGDEGTHVPLVIVDPRKKPGEASMIARDVDLAPTLYALTGVDAPADLDGRSLAPLMDGGDVPPALAYAETGLWFTEDAPAVTSPTSAPLRLPYPAITHMTELDPAHGDEVVLERAMRPLTIVAKHRMVRDEKWKLVYAPTRAGAKYMLFDTEGDPLEERDVAAEHPAELARLKTELVAWMARDPDMRVQGDVLVPRDLAELAPGAGGEGGVRLGGAP